MADTTTPKPAAALFRDPKREAALQLEVKRQSQQCLRTIDLRLEKPGRCREFSYQGRNHYLDPDSVSVFENALKLFGGQYTIGVYERVTQPLDANKQTGPRVVATSNDKIDLNAEAKIHLIEFGYRPHRAESRLNYVSAITVRMPKGERISAKTLDVSLLGLRLLFAANAKIAVKDAVEISFEEMEARANVHFEPVAYVVVGIDKEPDRLMVRVRRVMRATEREFDRFIPHFIRSMSSRYKMELKDALPAVYASVYEQLYAQSVNYLHGFYGLHEDKLECLFVASTAAVALSSPSPLGAWVAKHLPRLVVCTDIAALNDEVLSSPQRLLALRLNQRQFVLPIEILRDADLRHSCLTLCQQAQEAQVFAMLWRRQPTLDDHWRDQALQLLPDGLKEDAERWRERVQKCTHGCALVPVRSEFTPPALSAKPAQAMPLPDWLLPYEMASASSPLLVAMGVRGARSKERYQYLTRVIVNARGHELPGETVDFSIAGLQLRLDFPTTAQVKDLLSISFVDLMKKIRVPAELEKQSYRVVRILDQGHVVCLERDPRVTNHGAAHFFAQIIQNNASKLALCPAEQLAVAEALLAEQMLAFGLISIPLFIARDIDKKPFLLGVGQQPKGQQLEVFKRDGQWQFDSLSHRDVLHDVLHDCVNNVGYVERVKRCELVWLRGDKAATDRWFVFDERIEPERRLKLLTDGLSNQRVRVFAAHVAPHPNIDRATLEQELQPITGNSRYRADVFRSELNRLVGVVELFDITASLQHEFQILAGAQA